MVEGFQRGEVVGQFGLGMKGLDDLGQQGRAGGRIELRTACVEEQLGVGKLRRPFVREHQRERGLADAAHAAQPREHGAAGGVLLAQLGQIRLAPDENERPVGESVESWLETQVPGQTMHAGDGGGDGLQELVPGIDFLIQRALDACRERGAGEFAGGHALTMFLLQALPARDVGGASAGLREVAVRKVGRANEGDDLFALLMRVVVFKLRPGALEAGSIGERLIGIGPIRHAGKVNDAVAFLNVIHQMLAQGAGGGAQAVVLGEDAETRPGERTVEDIAQGFEIIRRRAEKHSWHFGRTHAGLSW